MPRWRRLFSLAWYNNLTYAQNKDSTSKVLPITCCNRPSSNSIKPDYIKQKLFIDTTTLKFLEVDQEWIDCCTSKLKKRRTETSIWVLSGIKRAISESCIMPNSCLATMSKSEKSLNSDKLIEVFEPWHGVVKYAKDILSYFSKISPSSDTNSHFDHLDFSFKTKQKDTLQALHYSKKQQNMDDPLIAEKT